MTTFCLIQGTPPSKGRIDTFLRKFSGSPNDLLASHIIRDDIMGLSKKIRDGKFDVNDPVIFTKEVNYTHHFWRTPLELAVDCGANADVIVFLLEKGAKITPPTLRLAIDGATIEPSTVPVYAPYDFANAEKIVEVLSAAGANWGEAFYNAKPIYSADKTPLDLIDHLGLVRAQELGITPDCEPGREPLRLTSADQFLSQKLALRQAGALEVATGNAAANTPKQRF